MYENKVIKLMQLKWLNNVIKFMTTGFHMMTVTSKAATLAPKMRILQKYTYGLYCCLLCRNLSVSHHPFHYAIPWLGKLLRASNVHSTH